MPKLYVAIPTHSRSISVPTAVTLLNLQVLLPNDWAVQFAFHSASVISDLRNTIVAQFLAAELDALLMIDADQGLPAEAIVRMLRSPYPVVGAFYPRRNFFWNNVRPEECGQDRGKLVYQAMRFVGNPKPDANGQVQIVDGFVRATGVGGGAMLIRRPVFDQMQRAYPELAGLGFPNEDENVPLSRHNWGFFNPIIDREKGLHLGEDLSFCKRWIEGCGGEIWAEVTASTEHVGQVTFRGSWLDYLTANGGTIA